MYYITEDSGLSMLKRHRCFTFADSLRYGINSKCKDCAKLYDMNSRDMVRRMYKKIRNCKEVKSVTQFRETTGGTWKLSKTPVGL